MLKKVKKTFKPCGVQTAKTLKHVWSFFIIIHEKVNCSSQIKYLLGDVWFISVSILIPQIFEAWQEHEF